MILVLIASKSELSSNQIKKRQPVPQKIHESIDDFDSYGNPTQWEFRVYKDTWIEMWEAPPGNTYEIAIIESMAKKYNTTHEHIDKILLKFEWYFINQDYETGKLVEDMTWSEFQKLFKKMGPPWPKERKKKLGY